MKYKKRIRLTGFDYKGYYRYFITICNFNKALLFKDALGFRWLIDILREKSLLFDFKIWVYCFMPDHLHLLIEGLGPESDMRRFIPSYKQSTGYYYKKENGGVLWQINYYDHVLRKEEDTMKVAYYILDNPVRKALVKDYRQYEFVGSFEFDILHP